MAEIITMPRLSDTMEEGTLVKWHKSIGDHVEEGDLLAEIETDKATMEFESFQSGHLLKIHIQEGQTIAVDAPICVLGAEGESADALPASNSNTEESSTAEPSSVPATQEISAEPVTDDENIAIVTMPRLSDTMEEGTLVKWHKSIGDKVSEGDLLAEIETDKATMEFESFQEGYLIHQGIGEGETTPVDSLLAVLGEDKDTPYNPSAPSTSSSSQETIKQDTSVEAVKSASVNQNTEASSHNTNSGRVLISPLAKRLAKEKNIPIENLNGSGENGRIIKRDVESYVPSTSVVAVSSSSSVVSPIVADESSTTIPHTQMRKTIAKRLSQSKFTAPHYYLSIKVGMDHAMKNRKAINDLPDTRVSFNDMVIKATAHALLKHKKVNTSWTDTDIIQHEHVHMGVAVAVEEGLVVPVVKHATTKSLTQIGAEVRQLASLAKEKKITPDQMEGSTFTISNLGMFGISEFTSIINSPNSAILSVGAIIEEPIVKNGEIVVGHTMALTLACDHRCVDGATGASFLQTLKNYLENPVTMLA